MTEIKKKQKSVDITLKNLIKVKEAALACVHCGQCRVANWPEKNVHYVCPVYKTDVTPKFEPYFARGKNLILKGLFWGDLELSQDISELIFQCTLCGACEDFCHNSHNDHVKFKTHDWVDQVNVFEALRADLIEAGFPIESHIPMNKSMVELLNPYERDNKGKNNWTHGVDFKISDASKEDVEILYFVGCSAALTPQIENIAINTAKILNRLGINFGIFGEKEVCCGSVALRTGDRKAFEKVSEKNVKLFEARGIKKIITSCAGCYRTLKKDYKGLLKDVEILHMVEFFSDLIDANHVPLNHLDMKTTYHDPCHLGRHLGIYEAPRTILNKISVLEEMKTTRETAMCCGAGGGVRKGFPELSIEMAKNRIKDAEETGASYLVSTCPFCYRNLSDAIAFLESGIQMVDLTELILKALQA